MRKKAILAIGALLAGAVALSACDCLNSVLTEHAIRTLADEMFAEAAEMDANVPGLLVGVWDEEQGIALVYALGEADKATGEALTPAHSFKIASVTKTMVGAVIGQLIDEGLLTFDTPVADYFPDLPGANEVTIRMLGDMSSGYFDYLEDEDFLDSFDNTPNFTATPTEMIDVSMAYGLQYTPGTDFNYSNTNTVILGQIIEAITGNSLEQELETRLFGPMGFEKTGAPAAGSYLPEPQAHCYHPETREDWTEKMDYSPEYACGNAHSVLAELRTWVEALAQGSLVSADTYAQVFDHGRPFPGTPDCVYYFGLMDYKGYLGHSGVTDYYLTEAFHHPGTGATIVVLANSSATGFTTQLFHAIAEILDSSRPAAE